MLTIIGTGLVAFGLVWFALRAAKNLLLDELEKLE